MPQTSGLSSRLVQPITEKSELSVVWGINASDIHGCRRVLQPVVKVLASFVRLLRPVFGDVSTLEGGREMSALRKSGLGDVSIHTCIWRHQHSGRRKGDVSTQEVRTGRRQHSHLYLETSALRKEEGRCQHSGSQDWETSAFTP